MDESDTDEPTRPLSWSFGGPGVRDRFTDAVWQGPTWSFAILLVVLDLTDTRTPVTRTLLIAGFAGVMVVTLLAVVTRWERLPSGVQVLLPLGDLVGGSLMVLADPAALSSTVLLLALPVVWLAFEFGRRATQVAITGVLVTGAVSYLLGALGLRSGLPPRDGVVVLLFVVGLAVVARLMGGILRRIGSVLRAHASETSSALALAEAQLVTLTSVMESIDAGVTILRVGVQPLLNGRAATMSERAGVDPDSRDGSGSLVFLGDRTTPVRPSDQVLSRAMAGQEFAGILHWIGEPGEQMAMMASARRMARSDGEHLGMVLAAWDATDMMDAIRLREDFVATVSHELRTPLTAITASLELLTELVDTDDLVEEAPWLLAASTRNAALLAGRISELLASAQSVDAAHAPRRTDVSELVGSSLAKHDPSLTSAGLRLVVDVEPDVVADVDPARFEQVVDNLLSNAIKYSRPAGVVRVDLGRGKGEELLLSVSDSGVGMTPDERRQAFDRFYRSPAAKARAIQGLGIGLGLVKSIVERHRGRVDIASELGIGTTVSVRLPLTAVPTPDLSPVPGGGQP